MKTITGWMACGALVLGAGLLVAEAAGPAPKGKVLLLENERVLEGQVERVGEQYRVVRTVGETWVPATRVLCLCGTLEEAYAFLHGRANLRDPDERLRLARWCRLYGLHAQALEEARAAAGLRPSDPEVGRLVRHLEQSAVVKPEAKAPPKKGPLPQYDLTAEALGLFCTRVQPILMNACAGCHTAGRGGAFQLTRAYGVGHGNKRTTQENVAAVLGQVNLQQPVVSPFLTKAVSAHAPGMQQAPLKGRQAAAYRALEDWVRLTLAANPQLHDRASAPPGAASAPPAAKKTEARWGEDAPAAVPTPAALPPRKAPAAPKVEDPVDPDGFNRQFHAPAKEAPPPAAPKGGVKQPRP